MSASYEYSSDLKNEIVSQQLELFALPTNLTEKMVEKRLHGFFEDPDVKGLICINFYIFATILLQYRL